MIKVISIDDHPFVLEGYQSVLQIFSDIDWLGGFSDPNKAESFLKQNECDVVMMDIHLGDGADGIHWCKKFSKELPHLKMLGISTFDEFGIIKSFLRAGGNGFILKTADKDILHEAILAIYEGEEYLQSELKDILLDQALKNKKPSEYIPKLSLREKEILKLIVEEYTTQEMADALNLSAHTIESHRGNLIAKLQVKNVAGLVREAYRKNLI
ncbi:MAG: response regulator transcription factor [Saprospiraceae bacterium]|nr:response regulator transcription factor [Saprospiraceae bacterium]